MESHRNTGNPLLLSSQLLGYIYGPEDLTSSILTQSNKKFTNKFLSLFLPYFYLECDTLSVDTFVINAP